MPEHRKESEQVQQQENVPTSERPDKHDIRAIDHHQRENWDLPDEKKCNSTMIDGVTGEP